MPPSAGRRTHASIGARLCLHLAVVPPRYTRWSTPPVPADRGPRPIAINPNAVATGYRGDPEISASKQTVVHMESAPGSTQLSTAGTPNVVSAPARSLWQTDSVAVRIDLRVAWAALPGEVAFVSSATW